MNGTAMNLHLRAPCAAVLCAATLSAHAQTMYKCTTDGKVSYGDAPCAAGASSVTLEAPPAPAPVAAANGTPSRDLKRLQKESAALEKARLQREEKDERASDRAAQAAAVQRKKCGKLKLNKQWADEDVRRAATITNIDNAKLRAKRAGETLALECPK
jgi:hypothetical protein